MFKNKLLLLLVIILTTSQCTFGQGVSWWQVGNPYVSRMDAAINFSEEYALLMSGSQMLFQPMVQINSIEPLENVIPRSMFPPQYNSKPISAALSADEQVFLAFKGNVYVPVDKSTMEPIAEPAAWTGWPGFWKNEVDAALQWADGSYVFIKGLQYVSYNTQSGVTSRPQQLNRLPGWPSKWAGSIDAAFNGYDGYLYFVRKGELLAMNANSMQFAPGYPKLLSGDDNGMSLVGKNVYTNYEEENPYKISTEEKDGIVFMEVDPNLQWCLVGAPKKLEGDESVPHFTKLAGSVNGDKEFTDLLPHGSRVAEIHVYGTSRIEGLEIITHSKSLGMVSANGLYGSKRGKKNVFKLFQGECLTAIVGTWGGQSGDYIYTLGFITSERTGPVFGGGMHGKDVGKYEFYFDFPSHASFAGFYGYHSDYIQSLGMKYYLRQLVYMDEEGNVVTGEIDISGHQGDEGVVEPEIIVSADSIYFDQYEDMFYVYNPETKQYELRPERDLSHYKKSPSEDWIGKTVDFTIFDPMEISSAENARPKQKLNGVFEWKHSATNTMNSTATQDIWSFPQGVDVATTGSGEGAATDNTITSFDSYSKEWRAAGSASVGVPGIASGSLSASHKERKTQEIGRERTLIQRTAKISVYTVHINLWWSEEFITDYDYGRILLRKDFRRAVGSLQVPGDESYNIPLSSLRKNGRLPESIESIKGDYMDLIKTFGTHYLNDIEFGGKFASFISISKDEVNTSKLTEDEIKMEVEAEFLGVSAGASGEYSEKVEVQKKLSSVNIEAKTFVMGGGGQIDKDEFSKAVAAQPVPIDCSLDKLSEILTSIYFPGDTNISIKQKVLSLLITQYIIDRSTINTNTKSQFQFPTNNSNIENISEMINTIK